MSLIACGGGSLKTPSTSSNAVTDFAGTSTTASSTPTNTPTVTPSSANTGGSGTTTSSPAVASSSIPSSAVVLGGLEDGNGVWSDCSECAGGAVTSSYWSAPNQTEPSLSGASRQFSISGGPWSDVLWIRKVGAHNEARHFLWDFYVYFDNDSAANVWSAEYDFWQVIDHQKYMVGSQCNFGDGHWDIWDSSVSKWINSGIPCERFSGGKWHHIVWDMERLSGNQYRYNTLWVDDKEISVQRTFYAEPTDWDDNVGVQWQLDQNGNGTPVNQWVDKVKLTMW